MNIISTSLNKAHYHNLKKELSKRILTLTKYIPVLLFLGNEISYAQQWYFSFVPNGRHTNSIKILDPTHIVAGGGNEFNDSLQDIFLSSDKGLTWDYGHNFFNTPWIKSLTFTNTVHGISVGYSGTILKTNDGSKSWLPVSTPINRQFNKVTYTDPQTFFIVGGSVPRTDTLQTILKSIDSGKTWSVMLDRKGYWLKGIDFSDATHGIAVGDSGVILRTIDGGVNWSTVTSPVIRTFNCIKFIKAFTWRL